MGLDDRPGRRETGVFVGSLGSDSVGCPIISHTAKVLLNSALLPRRMKWLHDSGGRKRVAAGDSVARGGVPRFVEERAGVARLRAFGKGLFGRSIGRTHVRFPHATSRRVSRRRHSEPFVNARQRASRGFKFAGVGMSRVWSGRTWARSKASNATASSSWKGLIIFAADARSRNAAHSRQATCNSRAWVISRL
jgi:hypothetical protein